MRFRSVLLLVALGLAHAAAEAAAADRAGHELSFPSAAFAKLDTFEGLNLEDADRLFNKKDYRGAYSAYKAYSDEFSKGRALSYAILRMGRCLHLLNKRNAAIKVYQEVVDYFPDDVRYAAGALYHMGQAHQQNGDGKKCLATWARMVKDKDYVAQPNSGTALEFLAKAMDKAKKYEEAAGYRWRIAVTYRNTNHHAVNQARSAVVYYYTIRSPNHEKFKKFYKDYGGFHRDRKLDDLDNSFRYWQTVFGSVLSRVWSNQDREMKAKAASYWSAKLGGRLADNDHIQVLRINSQFMADKDSAKWEQRIHAQFERGDVTMARLKWWAGKFVRRPKQQRAFLEKHKSLFKGASFSDIAEVVRLADASFRDDIFEKFLASSVRGLDLTEKLKLLGTLTGRHMNMPNAVSMVLRTVKIGTAADKQLVSLAGFAARTRLEEPVILRFFSAMKNKNHSIKARYDYYYAAAHPHHRCNKAMAEKALIEVNRLAKMPQYSQSVLWPKAELLKGLGQYAPAVKAYKAANKQPDSTWKVVDCQIAMKQYSNAIKSVKALESVGGRVASSACMKVADIYRISGNKGKEIEQLRVVLRRYPKSGESSHAHQRLESYGAKVTGGRSKADE